MKEWTSEKLDRALFEKWDLIGCSFCNCFSLFGRKCAAQLTQTISFLFWVSAFSNRKSCSWAHGLVGPQLLTAISYQFKVIPFTGQCLFSKRLHLNENCSCLMWDLMHMPGTKLHVKWPFFNMFPFALQEHFAFKCWISFCTSTATSALYCRHQEESLVPVWNVKQSWLWPRLD